MKKLFAGKSKKLNDRIFEIPKKLGAELKIKNKVISFFKVF